MTIFGNSTPTSIAPTVRVDRSMMPTGLWKTPRGAMHGYAHGATGQSTGKPVVETCIAKAGKASYADDLIVAQALTELDQLSASGKPWFLAVGFIKPHPVMYAVIII